MALMMLREQLNRNLHTHTHGKDLEEDRIRNNLCLFYTCGIHCCLVSELVDLTSLYYKQGSMLFAEQT